MNFPLKSYAKARELGMCRQEYDDVFLGLWRATKGAVCATGCPHFNMGKCRGYLWLKGSAIINEAKPKPQQYTTADLAAKWGVSKRQASKMRKKGEPE